MKYWEGSVALNCRELDLHDGNSHGCICLFAGVCVLCKCICICVLLVYARYSPDHVIPFSLAGRRKQRIYADANSRSPEVIETNKRRVIVFREVVGREREGQRLTLITHAYKRNAKRELAESFTR